ncbi:MAG: protein kinase [Bryobacteraceae bacterium]|nr:protein kinase [Bryobacteraceae bacterium]
MNPEQWRRVCDLLEKYSGLPSSERLQCLQRHEGEEPAVIAEALRIADLSSAARRFLSDPAAGFAGIFPRQHLQSGTILSSRFQIVRFLGSGGMGEVYEALDLTLNEPCALKQIRTGLAADEVILAMFQTEVQLARRVTHANVCRIFDLGSDSGAGVTYLTMELLTGGSLADKLSEKSLPAEWAEAVIVQVAGGLAAAHAAGVLHRDLKPGNVLFRRPNHPEVCITDFGLALVYAQPSRDAAGNEASGARPQPPAGTPGYLAPECLEGQPPTPASDVYALGLLMHEVLTGSLPFHELGPLGAMVRRCKEAPPPLESAIPAAARFQPIVARCLAPDPRLRYRDALEVQEAIRGEAKRRSPVSRRTLIRAGFAASLVAPAVLCLRYINRSANSPEGRRILIAPVEAPAGSGLDVIEVALRQLLRQSSRVEIWDATRLPEVLSRMGRNTNETLPPSAWREIALREQVPQVLFPAVTRAGDGLVLTVRLEQVNASTARFAARSWQKSFEAASRHQLLDAGQDAANWVRGLEGEPAAVIQEANRPPRDITTESWEALSAFHRGEQKARSGLLPAALLEFDAALRHDPEFTMAWMRKGDLLMGARNMAEGLICWSNAIRCSRARPLSRREDLMLRAMFADDTGDPAAAEKLFAEFAHYFPDEPWGFFNRALPLMNLGLFEEAIATLERCRRFPERRRSVSIQLCQAHTAKQSHQAALAETGWLRSNGFAAWASRCEAGVHYSQRNSAKALEALRKAKEEQPGDAEWRSEIEQYELIALADTSPAADCLKLARQYAAADEAGGFRMSAAMKLVVAATMAAASGGPSRDLALRACAVDNSLTVVVRAAAVLARRGFPRDAREVSRRLDLSLDVPRVRAARLRLDGEIALAEGRVAEALRALDRARREEVQPFGHEYWAYALGKAGRKEEMARALAEVEARRHHQIRLLYPEPPVIRWA